MGVETDKLVEVLRGVAGLLPHPPPAASMQVAGVELIERQRGKWVEVRFSFKYRAAPLDRKGPKAVD